MRISLFDYTGAIALAMSLMVQPGTASQMALTNEVTIDNFSFIPQTVAVPVGTTVVWVNRDDIPHTVTSVDKKSIVSRALDTNEKFAYTFTVTGTNDYYCSVHPHMKGRIVVH